MEWFKEKAAGIFINYINIMFMLAIAIVCYRIKGFSYFYVSILYIILVSVYWIFTGALHRGIQRVITLILVMCAFILFCMAFKNRIIDFFYMDIVDNIDAINTLLIKGKSTYFYQFKPIITIVLPIIVYLLFFFYSNRITSGVLLLTLAEMAFFWYLDYSAEVKKLLLPFIIISLITYLFNNYRKITHEFQKKGIYSSLSGKRLIINIVLFSMLVGIIGMPLPQEIRGKDSMSILDRFENKYTSTGGNGIANGIEGSFGLQSTGYNNTEKRLGGPISLDRSVAFVVESDELYYLKGNIKDEYTGYSWKNNETTYSKLTEAGSSYINGLKHKGTLIMGEPKQIKIFPEKLKTTSFMVPMFTNNIVDYKGDIFVNEENSTFISSSKVGKEYVISFYNVVENKTPNGDMYGTYYFNDPNYQKYLQLPETITERTVKLVYELVKDCNNNKEKVDKLKEYLSKNYTYTLSASVLPDGKDFVDYFLFEDKKGYCVHFATALSVMCRIAGIPSRFVEGYKMGGDKKISDKYDVTNDMAHAWVEYLVQDNFWDIGDCAPTALENEKNEETQQTSGSAPTEPSITNNQSNKPEKQNEEEKVNTDKGTKVESANVIAKVAVYSSAATIVVILVAVLAAVFIRKKRKMYYSESLVPLHNYMMKRLKHYKIQKAVTETEKEFALKQEKELREILLPLVKKLYDEFYGGIKDDSINKKELYFKFEQFLKKKENKLRYYLKKCF